MNLHKIKLRISVFVSIIIIIITFDQSVETEKRAMSSTVMSFNWKIKLLPAK